MHWQKVTGENIIATIEGSDPRLRNQRVVIQAYYDSISLTPDQAPGAENAASIAAMMELAKGFTQQPPKRTVVFLATSGHFQALSGTKAFVREFVRGSHGEKRVKHMFELANNARKELEDSIARVWEETERLEEEKTPEELADERLRAMGRIERAVKLAARNARRLEKTVNRARREDPNRGKLFEQQLEPEELEERAQLIEEFAGAVPGSGPLKPPQLP